MPFDDLRSFISSLEKNGQLLRVKKEVDPKFEIAAYIRKTSDQDGPALFFENVRGSSMPVVGGLFSTRKMILHALETTKGKALEDFIKRVDRPLTPRLVTSGPCKEVIITDSIDLTKLPIPTYHEKDAGPFITLGVQISKDPETRSNNVGIYRMQLHGRNLLGLFAGPGQNISTQYRRAEMRNEPLAIAIALGVDPAVILASQIHAHYGLDELSLAGGLLEKPVEVVKCETVDLEVPATSEIVIEGRVLPHERRLEGPFGEFTGYYTAVSQCPVVEVTAITHRRDPIFLAGLTGVPSTENHMLKELPLAVTLYRHLKADYPSVTGVHFLPGGTSHYIAAISIDQRYLGEARQILLAALGSKSPPKIAIVCDADIDVYDQSQVLWALATRSQPDSDVIIVPNVGGPGLDPSSKTPGGMVTAMMGIDATIPFGEPFPEPVSIPGLENVPDLLAVRR